MGITELRWGGICERFSRFFRHGPASARCSCAKRRDKDGGFVPPRHRSAEELSLGFAAASGSFGQQFADDHEIVGEHRGADKQREALGAFGAAALHAAATHQHRDAPLDAGTEALALFEGRRWCVSWRWRRLAAAALRDRDHGDAASRADSDVALAEEAAIGTIEGRGTAEDAAVTPDRGRHVDFVHRVAFEKAHSTAKCNGESFGVEENLTRSSVAEYLSGARVEFILDLLDIGI